MCHGCPKNFVGPIINLSRGAFPICFYDCVGESYLSLASNMVSFHCFNFLKSFFEIFLDCLSALCF